METIIKIYQMPIGLEGKEKLLRQKLNRSQLFNYYCYYFRGVYTYNPEVESIERAILNALKQLETLGWDIVSIYLSVSKSVNNDLNFKREYVNFKRELDKLHNIQERKQFLANKNEAQLRTYALLHFKDDGTLFHPEILREIFANTNQPDM